MGVEIERKFLVVSDDWRARADEGRFLSQGYLTDGQPVSVRVRIQGDVANLNIKSATLGISRLEYEYPIPMEDAREMLQKLAGGKAVEKMRYHVPVGRHVWEVDVFSGDNAGLVVAEVELSDADEDFERPSWAGEEVSHDPRYYNVRLIDHPYKDW
ncbi:MAG: CYTH domain-containing protein [Chromatiales bacterium]|nr:CYTH domain-containing protein [Chromatiales bacterium]